MTEKTVWTQESSHHFTLLRGGRRVDVRYEHAGFQSAWAVYVGSNVVDRCAEFMQARGIALRAAEGA